MKSKEQSQFLEEARYSLRGWIHELNTNKRALQHLANRAIKILQWQIERVQQGKSI